MAPDAKGADSGPSRMERPATHTGEGYKLVMDVGGGGGGATSPEEPLGAGQESELGRCGGQVVLRGWPLVGCEGMGVLGCYCFQGA